MSSDPYSGRSHPWTAALYERLRAAGDWVKREELIAELAPMVPAEFALAYNRRRLRAPDRMTEEELIASGRRQQLLNAMHNHRFELAERDGSWQLRLRPQSNRTPRDLIPRAEAWTVRAVELLWDRQWHRREEVLAAMAKLVPPGKAHRRAENNRLHLLRQKGQTHQPRVRPRSDEFLIASGKRSIAAQALVKMRVLDREVRDGEVWLRLRPDV